jgi:hypothetical protein
MFNASRIPVRCFPKFVSEPLAEIEDLAFRFNEVPQIFICIDQAFPLSRATLEENS